VEPARIAETPEIQRPPGLNVAIVSDEDHPGAEGVVGRFAPGAGTCAITRGPRGATLWGPRQSIEIPAAPAREVDPTGAGDVFGVVLTQELAAGGAPSTAGRAAAAIAARVVEGPGLGTLAATLKRP
jgi:sugar/nucleoside kinase (ribokinase family)